MSDTVVEILQTALDALQSREDRLEAIRAEVERTAKARKGIERTLRDITGRTTTRTTPRALPPGGQPPSEHNPRAAFTERLVEAVENAGRPLTLVQIAFALNRDQDNYLRQIVNGAVAAGQLAAIGEDDETVYSLPGAS